MSYATINDVFARYKPIGTIVGSSTNQVTSVEVSSSFIFSAEALIDAYAARRYSVPLPANALITQIAADLAIFNILVEHLPQMPDFMQKRYDRCMDFLKDISSGNLVVASATVLTTGTTDQEAWSSVGSSYHTIFSPVLDAEDQRVDSGRHDAEADDRAGDTI